MALYDTFQDLRCAAQRRLQEASAHLDAEIGARHFSPDWQCARSFAASPHLGRLPYEDSCAASKPAPAPAPAPRYGYDAYRGEFEQDPDRRNTFHNYLTTQVDDAQCVNNHQFFENWTRKRVISPQTYVPGLPEPAPPLPPRPEADCDVFKALGYGRSNLRPVC